MNSKRLFIIALIAVLTINQAYSQINYSMKAETGFLKYQINTIQVDPGPNWKGYYLDEENGIDIYMVNGIDFKNKIFAGIGIGYLNFEGTNGLSIFTDFEYLPFHARLTPLINLKFGYSHVENQYENGTGTGLGEVCLGLNYSLTEKMGVFVKSGITLTQQSLFIPIRLGIRFNDKKD